LDSEGSLWPELLFQTPLAFLSQSFDKGGGAGFEFRMILVLPGAGRLADGRQLPLAHELSGGSLHQKLASAALANDLVNVSDQLLGNHHVGSADAH